jgi:hypothetical protein
MREHVPRQNALTVINHFEGIDESLLVKLLGIKSKPIALPFRKIPY